MNWVGCGIDGWVGLVNCCVGLFDCGCIRCVGVFVLWWVCLLCEFVYLVNWSIVCVLVSWCVGVLVDCLVGVLVYWTIGLVFCLMGCIGVVV